MIATDTGMVAGSVLTEKRTPSVNAVVVLVPYAPAQRRKYELYKALTTDIQGRFRFTAVPPGDYRAFAWPYLSNAYVKSMRMGERDVLREGVQLQGAPTEPLEIVIGSGVGTLVGRVVDDQQRPVKNALVALLPKDAMRFRTDHRFLVTTEDTVFSSPKCRPETTARSPGSGWNGDAGRTRIS